MEIFLQCEVKWVNGFPSWEGTQVSDCTEQNWSAVLQGKQLALKAELFKELLREPPPQCKFKLKSCDSELARFAWATPSY